MAAYVLLGPAHDRSGSSAEEGCALCRAGIKGYGPDAGVYDKRASAAALKADRGGKDGKGYCLEEMLSYQVWLI